MNRKTDAEKAVTVGLVFLFVGVSTSSTTADCTAVRYRVQSAFEMLLQSLC